MIDTNTEEGRPVIKLLDNDGSRPVVNLVYNDTGARFSLERYAA